MPVPNITITPEVGRPANITYFNIYAGRAILHGISHLLLPDLPQDPNQAPPPADDEDVPPEGQEEDPQAPPPNVAEESAPKAAASRSGSGTAGQQAGGSAAGLGPVRRGSSSSSSAITAPVQGSNRGQQPAAGPSGMRPQLGTRPPQYTDTAALTPQRSSIAAMAGGGEQDDDSSPGRRLLSLPRSMLAAGLRSARVLLISSSSRGLTQASRAKATPMQQGTTTSSSSSKVGVSGALSSTVNVGAMGELQTFPNGLGTDKTLTALTLSAEPKVPKKYVNRYGSFKGPKAKGGCLNCKSWGRVSQ